MSFSWWCKDKAGKDLFDEFEINGQALGLGGDQSEYSLSDLRSTWIGFAYKEKLEDAARDAVEAVQGMVARNLAAYDPPAHPDCPMCKCVPAPPPRPWGVDLEQARRFLLIPLDRVHRAGGSY